MGVAISRRGFLQAAVTAPLLTPEWRKRPPVRHFRELRALMRAGSVPGAVIGALQDFKVAWIAPLGVRRAGGGEAVTPSTLFQAASLTKQVTAEAAHRLREAGQLDFDRPLADYVDDLPHPQARKVTARHVLSHTSGFPNWRAGETSRPLAPLVPLFAPGSRFSYSGEGYCYLQRVLEEVSGKGFAALARELVFAPCGMALSTLIWNPSTLARTAPPHGDRGQLRPHWDRPARAAREFAVKLGKPPEQLRYAEYAEAAKAAGYPPTPNFMQPNGAASLMTSAGEYGRFLAAALRNAEAGKQQVKIDESLGWALGWGTEHFRGREYLWQWGDNVGVKNIVFLEPATGSAIFVFTNGENGVRVYRRALALATGIDHPALSWLERLP